MFRATIKKKQKKTVTRLRADSDDDGGDDETATRGLGEGNKDESSASADVREAIKLKKSKKKKKGLVVMSFDAREGDDDDGGVLHGRKAEKKKKSKKRKRAGLGFGGGLNVVDEDDENGADQMAEEKKTSPLYGKAALEKLKAEQKYTTTDDGQSRETKDSVTQNYISPTASQPMNGNGSIQHIKEDEPDRDPTPALDDYIPLSDNKEPSMILTGDEAMLFETRNENEKEEKEDHFDTVMEDSNVFYDEAQQEQAEESSAWEAEITRRAGIQEKNVDQPPKQADRDSTNRGASSNGGSSAMSLVNLRDQVQSTISQLETQGNDVERACQRRRVELTQTKEELDRQQKELAEAGRALEDYQELRQQLAFWTGALRDLRSKVKPIQEALVDLDADIASCSQWQDWEDDMCSALHQAGLLDRVLGRQPPDSVFEDATAIVDEFGRDVKSQQAMHREKRTRRRLEIRRQRQQMREDESDAFSTEDELSDFRERLVALTNALNIAVEELEEEYTNLSNLFKVFEHWQSSYPEDYKQCFANLSLGDLASVLVQVELCQINPENTNSKGWLESLTSASGKEQTEDSNVHLGCANFIAETRKASSSGFPSMDAIDRLMDKTYIAVLTDVLDKSAYNLISKKQSRSLSALYSQLSMALQTHDFSRHHERFATVTNRLVDYIKAAFDDVAIVILKKDGGHGAVEFDSNEDSAYKKEELQDAVRGSTVGQLHRLSKMLLNVLNYWSPHLPSAADRGGLVEFLLDFLSSKFLYLLSSLRENPQLTTAIFSEVWSVLKETKWLERPELMLHAAPLRAAAVAYNLT